MEQQRTTETGHTSEETLSPQATAEAIAIANQQEWSKEGTTDIDDMLDDIDKVLEEESVALNFKQKGGQ